MTEQNQMEKNEHVKANKNSPKTMLIICALVILAVVFFSYIQPKVLKPMQDYNNAIKLLENGEYDEAEAIFKELGDYKDSVQQIDNCKIAYAESLVRKGGSLTTALDIYTQYADNENVTPEMVDACKARIYDEAIGKYEKKEYYNAKNLFEKISDYSDSKEYFDKCVKAIQKADEDAERAAKEAEEKKAAKKAQEEKEEQKKRENSGIVGTWYAKQIINYLGNDMTDQMGDLSYCYITFNSDGTGVFSAGEDRGNAAWGGKHDFTWRIEDTGSGNGSIGTWTMKGDTDDIYLYDDHIVISTEKMDSIAYAMNFFCYR